MQRRKQPVDGILGRPAPGLTLSRDEELAERTDRLLGQLPVFLVWPERGKLAAGKAGAHADDGIMARDLVAADGPEQATAKERPPGAARFQGDEDVGPM